MPSLHLRDLNVEYTDRGSGHPVLLIHGFPLNRTLWEPQLEGLADTARMIAPDLRGHGQTDPLPGPYSMDRLAQDCQQLLDDLGVNMPVVVGGLSMGGYVTFAFYRLFPERVRALILAATRAGADGPEAKGNREKSAQLASLQGTSAVVSAMLPKMMAPQTYENRPALVQALQTMMETTSVEGVMGAQLGMKDRPDSWPTLARIDRPVLIVHGADDQLVPVQEAQDMHAALPNSRLSILPDAGHLVNLEQPELFNAAVRDFLREL